LLAAAQPNFAGKTITLIVGYKPGGGYDGTARMLARHLPQHIPGKPTVIAQLTGVQGVKFDITKFAWIGSAANETTILAIRDDLPYKTFADLRKAKEPVVIGSTGPGANTYDFPLLLKDMLGLNFKIVSGYSSSADIMLAVERKEVDGRAGSYSSIQPFIDRKLVRPVIRARSTDKRLQQLPLDEDFAPNPRAKAIMALRSAPEQIARPYVLPPNTPADIVKAMRD